MLAIFAISMVSDLAEAASSMPGTPIGTGGPIVGPGPPRPFRDSHLFVHGYPHHHHDYDHHSYGHHYHTYHNSYHHINDDHHHVHSDWRPESYDCQDGSSSLWGDNKKLYCCKNQNVGCDSAPKYDCGAGLLNYKHGWSLAKKMWCCKEKGLGCGDDGKPVPFDCLKGRENWRDGWSDAKKHWCCRNVHIGCEQPRPEEPTSEPFDCRAGLWNFREGWSKTKKDYCCRHHELGCESRPDVVIFPFTNKPVAKCAGVESEISSCVREPCLDLCEPVHCEFSDWSLWSNLGGCFGLCQRERKIIQPNNECGRPCHGPKVVTKAGGSSCMPDSECELEGDVNCHWDDWSEWSNTCFDVVVDQTHRWRKILVEPALNGRACDGPFNETRACAHAGRKDCKFSLWSKWTECTASCEGGTQSRLRQVDTFAEHGGAPCQGMLREAQACNPQVCPGNVACEVSEWSPWHGCTEAMFQKFRSRSLVNVPPVTGDQELFCEYSLMEAKGCPRGSDEPGLCKLTTWSEWGACSSECDGSKVRNRSIVEYMKKTCHVTDVETMMEVTYCGSRNCHNRKCVMTDWTEWSECSHRCGPGVMDRTREVTQGGNCEAPLKELRDCQVAVCQPEDCTWGDWTFWSSCTKSCGSGVHRRHREVKTAPRHGGKACDPKAREEVGFCNNQTCDTCIDGQWGPWSPWGRCSGTCSPAFRVRHRDPIKFPNHCGVPALGLEDEYELCDYLQECDDNQDCLLSSWSLWSDCSCECFGIKERSKRIVRNAKGDGKPCNATMKEVFPCNPGTEEEVPEKCLSSLKAGDCELSAWTEWTDCSASCDGGQRERERSVETPNLKGGQPCNNTLKEVEACSTLRCPNYHKCQSCEWGAWSEWGLCSKCGGQRYRTRIIAKMPDYCGALCDPGAAKEVGTCHSQCADNIYCLWSDWKDASGCSSECGHSARIRERHLTSTNRKPLWGDYFFNATEGFACSGSQLKSQLCDYVPCAGQAAATCEPVNCKFHEWSSWGEPSCTQLCDRHRTISVVNSCGGEACEGSTVETKHCVKPDCQEVKDCEFSPWHEWQSLCVNDQKVRFRVEANPATNGGQPCCGPIKETMPCETVGSIRGVIQDGAASPWSAWSDCTRPCGGGLRTRKRVIEVEARNGGYPFCGALKVLEPCNVETCGTGDGNTGDNCAMSDWGDWSACTEFNVQYRNRQITQNAKAGGTPCESGLRSVRECKTAVDCRMSPWTHWDRCTRTCGGGQSTRHRQVTRNPRFGGKPCGTDLIQTTGCNDNPCNIEDAQVSAWSSWSACDTDCGTGQQFRTRVITRGVQYGGVGFYGPLQETAYCIREECGDAPQGCVWGEWTQWTSCDRYCGGGQKTRERRIAKVPRNGGDLCYPYDKVETEPCNTQHCLDSACIDGKWGGWTEWESCSSTCHGGVTWRSRSIHKEANECGHPPLGFAVEHRGCNWAVECRPDQDCRFGDWMDWQPCTDRCFGVRERSRKIVHHGRGSGSFCTGPLRESNPCAEDEGCPHAGKWKDDENDYDCKLSEWTSWGDCDRPCGTGQMVRTRTVKQPGRHGGRPCDGHLAQVAPCTSGECDECTPTDCEWSEWADWGSCDQCDGQMRRHRRVKQHAQCGGKPCLPGASEQLEKCPRFCHAQTYCGWADWKAWSECSVTCGAGTTGRSRHLQVLAEPPLKLQHIRPQFACSGAPRGWDRAEFEWCCQNMPREGCEEERHFRLQAQKKVGQDDSVQAQKRLDSLVARSQSLESQRLFQILGAWAAGSITFFALHRVWRSSGSSHPSFTPLPME